MLDYSTSISNNGTTVPDIKFLRLLEVLLHHHKSLKKPDPFGVELYETMISDYHEYGYVSDGKLGYMLNRLHPNGKFSSYYSKVHQVHGTKKEPHPLLEHYRKHPEKLVLNAVCHGFKIKEEVKVSCLGTTDDFDKWLLSLIHQERISILQQALEAVNETMVISELPEKMREVLHQVMGQVFLKLPIILKPEQMVFFKKFLIRHKVQDKWRVY
jgi:hypothetical protein